MPRESNGTQDYAPYEMASTGDGDVQTNSETAAESAWHTFASQGSAPADPSARRRRHLVALVAVLLLVTGALVASVSLTRSTRPDRPPVTILGGHNHVAEFTIEPVAHFELLGIRVKGSLPVTITQVSYATTGPLDASTRLILPTRANGFNGDFCCGYGTHPPPEYAAQISARSATLEPGRTYGLLNVLYLTPGRGVAKGFTREITISLERSDHTFTITLPLRLRVCRGISLGRCGGASAS